MTYDEDKVDEMVLALLYLTLHGNGRAWKGHDWDAMERLHKKRNDLESGGQSEIGGTHGRGREAMQGTFREALLSFKPMMLLGELIPPTLCELWRAVSFAKAPAPKGVDGWGELVDG
jgi:hypothetical protein